MPAFALALTASSAVRVASLNLCTDEYLLLLAKPAEIASVSHLSHRKEESPLWRLARSFPANNGTVESSISSRPTMLLTMGGMGRDTVRLAQRLGIRLVNLPYPSTINDVARQARLVAAALGDPRRADAPLARLRGLRATAPNRTVDGAFLSGGGLTLSRGSLGAQWMALAGFSQRETRGSRLSLETMATNPPKWLLRSNYRQNQFDRGQAWLNHPLVHRKRHQTLVTDGRPWTCAGLPMISEVARLRLRRPR